MNTNKPGWSQETFSLDRYISQISRERKQPERASSGSGGGLGWTGEGKFSLDRYLGEREILSGRGWNEEAAVWSSDLASFAKRMSSDYAARKDTYQSADRFYDYRLEREGEMDELIRRARETQAHYTDYADTYDRLYGAGSADRALASLREGMEYLEGLRESLRSEGQYWGQFQNDEAWNQYQQFLSWQNLPNKPDFAEKSAYVSTFNPENEKFNVWSGTYTDTGYGDIYYDYINQNQHAQERQTLQDVNAGGPGSLYATTHSYWKDLPEDTIKTFNYIYATESPEAAYEYIDAMVNKTYTGIEALALNFLQGTGAPSISAVLGSGLSSISGDDEMGQRNQNWYKQLLQETAASAEEHPYVSDVGHGIGSLSTMLGISAGVGAIPAVSSLPTWVGGIISGAASMGGSTAIQEAGAAATGMIKPGDYALDVATAAAGGAAGGLASAGAAAGGRTLLLNLGLTNNPLANTIVAGLSGSSFSLADTGITETSKYLRDRENYELDESQVIQDAIVAFAFSSISYAIRNARTAGNTMPDEDPNARPKTTYFEDIDNIDDLKKAYRTLSKQNHPDVGGSTEVMAQINSEYEAMRRYLLNQSVSRAASAYEQRERQAASGQDTTAADNAMRKEAGILMTAVNDGTITGAEAAQAAEIIQAIAAAGSVGGLVSASGDVPTVPPVENGSIVPSTEAQIIADQLVQEGVDPTEAALSALAQTGAKPTREGQTSIVAGNGISTERTGETANNPAAVSPPKTSTVQRVKTEASLGERETGGLAKPEETQTHDVRIPDAPQAQTSIRARSGADVIADFADTMDKVGATVMMQRYDESQDPIEYISDFMNAYRAGQLGSGLEYQAPENFKTLNPAQIEAAYLAGQASNVAAVATQEQMNRQAAQAVSAPASPSGLVRGNAAAQRQATTQLEKSVRSRKANRLLRKWAANEWVNIDLDTALAKTADPATRKRAESFLQESFYRAGREETGALTKEEVINNGDTQVEEVPDGRGVLRTAGAGGQNAGGLLDGEGGGTTHSLRDRTNDGLPHPERWTAQRVGESTKAPKSVTEIIAGIEHEFGFNITRGHVRGKGVRGQFNTRDKGIRSKIANDLPTVCHELGHALDDRYDISGGKLTREMRLEMEKALGDLASEYKPEEMASEGLAEFLRQFLQNREVAAIDYPEFTKHFLSMLDGKDRVLIERLADEVNAYYSLDADSAVSSVRLREEGGADLRTPGEKVRQMGDEFYQAWVDSNHGIKLFDEATGSDVYKRATNAAYSDGIAGQIITGDLTDANGRYIGPGLKAALNGVNTRDNKAYKAFGEYLIVKHGPERLAEGMRIFADDRKNSTQWMQNRQAELEAQYPEFKAASERLYQFIADLNQTWGVGTGVIGAEQLDGWQKRWSYYVPLNRALEKSGRPGAKRSYANQHSPYRRARGSGLDITHPVDNIIDSIVLLVNVGVRNNVMRELRNSAIGLGADANWMEKVPTPLVPKRTDLTGVKAKLMDEIDQSSTLSEAGKNEAESIISNLNDVLLQFERGKAHGDVVTVLVDGEPEFWKINDKLLLESVTSMTPSKLHGFLEAYAVTTRFMTANITGNNPVWSIFSNAPRDLGTFAVYTKDRRPFKAIAAIGSAYINSFKDTVKAGSIDPLYAEYLAMGGGHTSVYSADADLAKNARKKLTYTKAQRILDTVNPVNWVSFVSDTIEMGPRFATYKLMREAGLSTQEAFYEAMDVTTNFRRGGYMGRDVNKVVPFFNAGVQGIDKFRRFFSGYDAVGGDRAKVVRNRWIAFFAASAALAALMYGINNGDDEAEEDYEQLSNYTKNSFWCIPLGDGRYFTIPKPRELAVLTSFMETCMERFVGGNEHAFDGFYQYFVGNFMPSVVSDVAQLPSNIVENGTSQGILDTMAGMIGSAGIVGVGAYMVANRDFLGRPIESATMKYLEPKDRYNSSTSRMAYWLGQTFDLSPAMVDYFGNQVLGYLWKVPKALFPVGENPDYSLGVKSTYVKDNAYSQDLVNWLYDRADNSAMAKKSDPENMDKAIAAKLDSIMTDFYSTFNTLNRGKYATTERRNTRQIVLTMISEYRQAIDEGYTSRAQEAVYDVVRTTGETVYMPSVMNDYVKDGVGEKHTLTDTQYVSYQTNYLNLYWSYVEENLHPGDSINKRAAVLNAAKSVAMEQATNAMLRRIGAPETSFVEKYDGVDDGDVIEYKARVATETDGTPTQDEAIAILEAMIAGGGTTEEEAYILFHSIWSESDKNNPWKRYAP